MIEFVTGIIESIVGQNVNLSVGPLCISIQVPSTHNIKEGSSNKLYIYLHWNQENGPSLYGFQSKEDKQIFEMILSCSGIGPKIGLALLAELSAQRLVQVVQAGDHEVLSTVNGIGPKKAEQLGVQLKHKVAKLIKGGFSVTSGAVTTQWQEIGQVLTSLRYSHKEVADAMKYVTERYGDQEVPFDGLVRYALSFLAKKG